VKMKALLSFETSGDYLPKHKASHPRKLETSITKLFPKIWWW